MTYASILAKIVQKSVFFDIFRIFLSCSSLGLLSVISRWRVGLRQKEGLQNYKKKSHGQHLPPSWYRCSPEVIP